MVIAFWCTRTVCKTLNPNKVAKNLKTSHYQASKTWYSLHSIVVDSINKLHQGYIQGMLENLAVFFENGWVTLIKRFVKGPVICICKLKIGRSNILGSLTSDYDSLLVYIDIFMKYNSENWRHFVLHFVGPVQLKQKMMFNNLYTCPNWEI